MKIVKLYFERESDGSIDPHSTAYRKTWRYTPRPEESDKILDEVKVNFSLSLRQYFQAQIDGDRKLLEKIKIQPRPAGMDTEDTQEVRPTGGSITSWTISIGQQSLQDSTQGFSIQDFPSVVFEKGEFKGEPQMLRIPEAPAPPAPLKRLDPAD